MTETLAPCPTGKAQFDSPKDLYDSRAADGKTLPVAYINCRQCKKVHADKNQVQDYSAHLRYYHPDAPEPTDAPPQPPETGKIPASIDIDLSATTDSELADYVIGAFNTIREAILYIQELRKRFASLPRGGADIAGCKTWEEFCVSKLNRTPSAIRKALAEQKEPESPKSEQAKLFEAQVSELAKPLTPFVTAAASYDKNKLYTLKTSFSSEQDLKNFIKRVSTTYPESGTLRRSLLNQIVDELNAPDPHTRQTRTERFITQLHRALELRNPTVAVIPAPALVENEVDTNG